MKEFKNVVLKLLAKQHGISEDKAADMLFPKSEADDKKFDFTQIKESALTELLNLDAARVTTIKESIDKTETYTKAYDKAKKDVLGKAEKALAEKYDIEYDPSKTKLDSLVKNIVSKNAKSPKGDGELTDDNIKKSQIYLALEKSKTTELSALESTHVKAIEDINKGNATAALLIGVKENAGSFFDKMNPILSSDKTKATNQRKSFLKSFDQYGYEKQTDGTHILIKGDGKRLEDKHGHPITLEQKVTEHANSLYDFKKQDNKGGTGDEGGGGGAAKKVESPDSKEAYNKAILEAPTMEARESIVAAYEAANKD